MRFSSIYWCSLSSNRKKEIFKKFTLAFRKVSAYHTGSAFTQQYYVCRVSFVLNSALTDKLEHAHYGHDGNVSFGIDVHGLILNLSI